MPDPSSALARLRPARRRPARTRVTRTEVRVIVAPTVPAARRTRAERLRSGAWTLYSRWQWRLAEARVERTRREAHPYRR